MDRKVYFIHPLIDALCVGGASIFVFLYFYFFYEGYSQYQVSNLVLSSAFYLTCLFNYPHFAATYFRLYQTKQKELFWLTNYLPILAFIFLLSFILSPDFLAPYYVKIFLYWSLFHYSRQAFGFFLLYAKRANFSIHSLTRPTLLGFVYCAFLYQLADLESQKNAVLVIGIATPIFPLPHWVSDFFRFATFGFSFSFLFTIFLATRKNKKTPPWIAFVPLLAHFVWMILGYKIFSFQALVPLFHGLQYLLLAWALEHKKSPPLRWALLTILLGWALFVGIPQTLSRALHLNPNLISAAFFVTIQIHHFIIDAYLWKTKGNQNHVLLTTSLHKTQQ